MIKRLSKLLLLSFVFLTGLIRAETGFVEPMPTTQPFEFEFDNFQNGVDTYHLQDKVTPGSLTYNRNFLTDEKFGLSRRKAISEVLGCTGVTSISSGTTLKLWQFFAPTNDEWLIRESTAGYLIAGKSMTGSGNCFSVTVTSKVLDVSGRTDAAVGLGKIWFTNKVDGLSSWDGTTYSEYASAPKAAFVRIFRNRVVLADLVNQQSSLSLSGELNGGDHTYDSAFSTSPVLIRVGGVNDGNKLTAVHVGLDEMLLFKAFSTFGLTGNDQRDFSVRGVSPEIGTIYPTSIAQRGLFTFFLSNRGIDTYRPGVSYMPTDPFQRVSEPIQDLVDPLATSNSAARNYIFNSSVWGQGTSSPTGNISTTLSAGAVRPANRTFTDSVSSDWSLGAVYSLGGSSLAIGPISLIYTSTADTFVQNGSFETAGNASTAALNWTAISTSGVNIVDVSTYAKRSGSPFVGYIFGVSSFPSVQFTPYSGSVSFGHSYEWQNNTWGVSSYTISLLDLDNNVLVSSSAYVFAIATPTAVSVNGSWFPLEINTTQYKGMLAKLRLVLASVATTPIPGATLTSTITSSNFYVSTSVTIQAYALDASTPGQYIRLALFDSAFTPRRPTTDFQTYYMSQVFDTLVTTPSYDKFFAGMAVGTATFAVQTSSVGSCCFGALTAITTGSYPTNTQNRYVQYVASFSAIGSTNTTTLELSSVTLGSYVTGFFLVSANVNPISSWGKFTSDTDLTTGGTITYQIQSSSDGNVNGSWSTQEINTTIGVAVNKYLLVRPFFGTSFSTNVPILNSITINWNAGGSPPDPLGITFRGRYLLYLSTDVTASQNNLGLIFNRNNVFDIINGYQPSAAAIYSNQLLLGDSNNTGKIFQVDASTDDSDAGTPVASQFIPERFSAGHPDSYKIWEGVYFTISRDDASASQIFRVEYSLPDISTATTSFNLEIATGTKVTNDRILFSVGTPIQSKYIDLRFYEVTSGKRYYVNRLKIYGQILPPD